MKFPFDKITSGFWSRQENRRAYLEWLARKLGFRDPEDWYKVTQEHFFRNGGRALLKNHFNGSPSDLLQSVYPEHSFIRWKFVSAPKNFWESKKNREEYVAWLVKRVGVSRAEELETAHFMEHYGSGLLKLFNGSPLAVAHSLKSSDGAPLSSPASTLSRGKKPKRYLESLSNQRAFMDSVGSQIGVKNGDMSPWYRLTYKDANRFKLRGILQIYPSLYTALTKIYPEHEWLPWHFTIIPKSAYNDPKVIDQAIKFVEKELNLKSVEDWERVDRSTLVELGVYPLLTQRGSLAATLSEFRPLASQSRTT